MSHPTKAGVNVDASQQVLIDSLPPILVLHLKRFCYDVTVGGVVKVSNPVRFGPELEISHDVLSATMRRGVLPKYKLFGGSYLFFPIPKPLAYLVLFVKRYTITDNPHQVDIIRWTFCIRIDTPGRRIVKGGLG